MFKVNVSETISEKMQSMLRRKSAVVSSRHQSHFFRLNNGLGLSVVSFPGIKTVSIRAFVFVGSVYENPDNNGISHFLEHMLFRGNEKLGDGAAMNVKMEELGGDFNAATSFDQTEYWIDFHYDYLETGVERFCHFLQFPLFEQIEVERSIILEEINNDYNEENKLIDLDSLSSELLWPDHPMGLPIIGNERTIKNISQHDLKNWHNQYYTPNNIILGITGDFDPEKIRKLVAKQFEQSKQTPAKQYPQVLAQPKSEHQITLVNDKDNQFSIQWSFPSYRLNKKLRIQYQLLRRILDGGNSSRLQRLIREEKGLVYDISLDTMFYEKGMIMSLQSVVGIGRLKELMESLVELFNDLNEKGITQDELDLAKRRFRAALECNNDTAQGILYDSLMPVLNPEGASYSNVLPILDGIDLSTINDVLRDLFSQQLSTFVLVGPWKEKDKQMIREKIHPWISGKKAS